MRHDIICEPSGSDYTELIKFCSGIASTGLVVVNEPQALALPAETFLNALSPHLIEARATSEWPGTKLYSRSAWVYYFRINRECCELLLRSATSLYSWIEPNLPEDLCLLRKSGHPILVTISHEHDAYLELGQLEASALRNRTSPSLFQ